MPEVGCRRRSAANTNRVPRTTLEEGGPIPLHRDTTINDGTRYKLVSIGKEWVRKKSKEINFSRLVGRLRGAEARMKDSVVNLYKERLYKLKVSWT